MWGGGGQEEEEEEDGATLAIPHAAMSHKFPQQTANCRTIILKYYN